jgi:hypothetical protein
VKKPFAILAILFLCALITSAQKQDTKASVEGSQKTSVNTKDKELTVESGTQLVGQLQTPLDSRKLKEGDPVILRTTQDIKSNGEVIFKKGSLLTGQVTEAQKKSKENKESKIGLLFDKLENASLLMPVNATLSSITQAAASANLGGEDLFATSGSASGGVSGRSQSSGGLLGGVTNTVGGVTNTVGGVANSTTQAIGGVVNGTTTTVSNTAGAVGQRLKGLQISQAANATTGGSSTLSLAGDNLKLEKGTVFRLLLNQQSKAEAKSKLKTLQGAKQPSQ